MRTSPRRGPRPSTLRCPWTSSSATTRATTCRFCSAPSDTPPTAGAERMSIELVHDSYGKSAIRLVKVSRHGRRHEVRDLTIDVRLEGAFERAHTEGDNSMILPTDTMKNTVYALAKDQRMDPPEHFALALGEHFLGAAPAATRVHIAIETKPWNRITIGGRGHDHSFSG